MINFIFIGKLRQTSRETNEDKKESWKNINISYKIVNVYFLIIILSQ